MKHLRRKKTLTQHIVAYSYTCSTMLVLLLIAATLQSGSANTYLFVHNDLIYDLNRILFVVGFPVSYVIALFFCYQIIRIPRFDSNYRLLVINLATYSVFGLSLSIFRIPLFSRTVFITEFILSTILLTVFFLIWNRKYPKHLGVVRNVNINGLEDHPLIQTITIDTDDSSIDNLDGVIADLSTTADDATSRYLAKLALNKVPIYDAAALRENIWGRVSVAQLDPSEIENLPPSELYSVMKRVGEVALVILFSPLIFLFLFVISIAIKLDSPGPIIFRQERRGQYKSSFEMLKFRSMYVTTKELGNIFPERKHSRVTRAGYILRRTHLDELPQVWNVLKGEMSLIGPRPEQIPLVERFSQLIPLYDLRHTVRPGITGWSQVTYGYAASDDQTRAKLEFDFFYIKHLSLWLDFVVFIKTIRVMAIGSGDR